MLVSFAGKLKKKKITTFSSSERLGERQITTAKKKEKKKKNAQSHQVPKPALSPVGKKPKTKAAFWTRSLFLPLPSGQAGEPWNALEHLGTLKNTSEHLACPFRTSIEMRIPFILGRRYLVPYQAVLVSYLLRKKQDKNNFLVECDLIYIGICQQKIWTFFSISLSFIYELLYLLFFISVF